MRILQKPIEIHARKLIEKAIQEYIPATEEDVYEMIVRHCYDPSVYEQVIDF